MVHTDTVAQETGKRLPEPAGEAETGNARWQSGHGLARVATCALVSAWARSTAAFWVK